VIIQKLRDNDDYCVEIALWDRRQGEYAWWWPPYPRIFYNPEMHYLYDGKKPWHYQYPEISLAHELIHALHDMNGVEDFSNEDLVIGLKKFKDFLYTENKIRQEYNVLPRPKH
jgi:hypothetical protein